MPIGHDITSLCPSGRSRNPRRVLCGIFISQGRRRSIFISFSMERTSVSRTSSLGSMWACIIWFVFALARSTVRGHFCVILTELHLVSNSPKLRILPTPKPLSQLQGTCPRYFSLALIYQRYSFVLAPLNYFDYDISMELQNAILLREPGRPGDPYSFDDNGVKQDYGCLPERLAPFEYETSAQWVEGSCGSVSPEDARRASEMYLRVRIGV